MRACCLAPSHSLPIRIRMAFTFLLALLLGVCLGARPGAAGPATTVADDFAAYPEGSRAVSQWDATGFGWEVRQGRFEGDSPSRSWAFPKPAPHGRRLVAEATLVLRRPTGKEWKLAGICVVRDDSNFWHLAVVEAPATQGSRHQVELGEMLEGRWLANLNSETKLKVVTDKGGGFNWQYDRPYRFRLEITAEGIEGTVHEMDGTECVRKAYAFDNRAVKEGRPGLVTSGLAAGFDDFRAEIHQQVPPPPALTFPAYTRPDPPSDVRGKATGFFHVEQKEGRWWVMDPKGEALYVVGTDHVSNRAHYCEALGYAPYARNVAKKYGEEAKWAASATDRLKQWRFNALGAGCVPSTRYRGLIHTEFLSMGRGFVDISDIVPRTTWTGFPDVFHPRWPEWCEFVAQRRCAALRDDPWLLGYFLDNELEWFGKNRSETGMVDEVFKKPADHPAKQALVQFLQKRYPTIAAFNRAWGAKVPSYEALAQLTEPLPGDTKAGQADRQAFVRLIAERYFSVTAAAIRKADPNHMILGCRFAGRAPGVWDICGRYMDIVTVNYYGKVDLDRGVNLDMPAKMAEYHTQSKRPLIITEWSFPALDSGLPCKHGAGQRVATQTEKSRAYSIYQQALFGMPFMVGSHYFMWVDEPELGISSTFPEDSNYGLVDVNDNPWEELTRTATKVNSLAYALHSGRTAELSAEILDRAGKAGPMLRVRNSGKLAARFQVRLTVQGKANSVAVSLAPGARQDIAISLAGSAFVRAEVDPEEAVAEGDRSDNVVEKLLLDPAVKGPAVAVLNPTAQTLTEVPITVPLGALGEKWAPVDASGQPVPAQVDALPGGAELVLRLPALPARSVLLVILKPGAAPLSRREEGADRALALPGKLRLEHDPGSGHLFDRVRLGDLLLGRFGPLVHQAAGQEMWVAPDRVERIETYSGPVRTLLLMTAALRAPEAANIKTAVDKEGVYARAQRKPGQYRLTTRIAHYPEEPWFTARFQRLENTDSVPWRCQSYYHYPISAIGGKTEDDEPLGSGNMHLWYDEGAGAAYGAVVDLSKMSIYFWKDKNNAAGEHADIRREVKQELKPGQALAATADDSEVFLFGARGPKDRPDGGVPDRLRALSRVRVSLVGGR